MLMIYFRGRPRQWKYDRSGATSDIIFRSEVPYFWRPSFTGTVDFRYCNRSRDVGHTSFVSVEHLEFFICRLPFWSYYYFWFTAATIYFWCSNTSRDVSHTSSASDDLENVGLAFGILLVPLAVLDLLLLAIVDGRI